MQIMYKKTIFLLCAFMIFSLAACSNMQSQDAQNDSESESSSELLQDDSQAEEDSQKPLLEPGASDEELLKAISSDINVISDSNYYETLAELSEHTDRYVGKLYQLEGTFTMKGENPYVTRTPEDGDETKVCGLPLKYLTKDMEEGSWVRVTGIVNEGEVDGEMGTVLEVLVIQTW